MSSYERKHPQNWKELKSLHPKRIGLWTIDWLFDNVVYYFHNVAITEFLKILTSFSIFWGLIVYIFSADERTQAIHYQAWQVINSAQGKSGNGGRSYALESLIADNVSLKGIDLNKAWLDGTNLSNSILSAATFIDSHLRSVNLSNAKLNGCDFTEAIVDSSILNNTNLKNTTFVNTLIRDAKIVNAYFVNSTIKGSDFGKSNMAGSIFWGCKIIPYDYKSISIPDDSLALKYFLTGEDSLKIKERFTNIYLRESDFSNANLSSSNISFTKINHSIFKSCVLKNANFFAVEIKNSYLDSADVEGCNFSNVIIENSSITNLKNWERIKSLKGTIFIGLKNVPEGFKEYVLKNGAVIANNLEEIKGQKELMVKYYEYDLEYSILKIDKTLEKHKPPEWGKSN